ncbi:chemotaxis protein CheB [Flavobacterium cerinum]|uniref:protein-glutamate methylesterase n=1 Tax=Flavobacterium cerinum TaxID=2502784 RepID=A0A444H6G4_9FLAO|nr:chemotaxis protein CheB [Flavobacterium cerinum]RWW98759.1 chemotaxis protein CheB [Flavobacterium cerinum]
MEKNRIISGCKLLIIGGSAGSLEVLMKILPGLNTLPSFAIVLVLHRKSTEDTTLEELIAIKTNIPVREVEDKTPLLPGYLYVAPSDYHLLFEKNDVLSLDISEKVNYSRPSIDVSFESAAEIYGKSLVGLLLSGANADGTEGLLAIKKAGGTTVVQNPESAQMPTMPQNAITYTAPDYILDIEHILKFITLINS